MDTIDDQALRARKQGGFDRHDAVAIYPSIFDEARVALADLLRSRAAYGVSRDTEVAQACLRVEGAGEELVYAGDGGEAITVRDVVWGAQRDQMRHATVSGVAPASVGRVPPDVHPAGEPARRVSHEHGLLRLALQQGPVYGASDLEDELPEPTDVSQDPVQGRD